MKRRLVVLVTLFTASTVAWRAIRIPDATVLSLRIGQTFEEVAAGSSYAVMEESNLPSQSELRWGATWVTKPAVVIKFNDPRHGFTLPPTKFAGVNYQENRVVSIETSPMLDKLPFDEAVQVLANLQQQLKTGGWKPWAGNGSKWFDLSPQGRTGLLAGLLSGPHSEQATLHVPGKYNLMLRIECAAECGNKTGALFLIDLSIGRDY